MKNWTPLNKTEMLNTTGEGAVITTILAGIIVVLALRSIFASKGSVSVNGVGKVNWEDPKPKTQPETEKETVFIDRNKELADLFNKFYEF